MKLSTSAILALPLLPSLHAACPLAGSSSNPPNDEIHNNLHQPTGLRRRRVASLSNHPDTKAKLDSIIANRKHRSLESTCFTSTDYDNIDADVASISDAFLDNETKGYFLGGVVRVSSSL